MSSSVAVSVCFILFSVDVVYPSQSYGMLIIYFISDHRKDGYLKVTTPRTFEAGNVNAAVAKGLAEHGLKSNDTQGFTHASKQWGGVYIL
jgi:hypothetical protein